MKHRKTALLLLVVGVSKTTAWKLAPVVAQSMIWNVSQSIAQIVVLLLLGLIYQSKAMWLVIALTAGLELQTAACSVLFLVHPWVREPDGELCSSGLHFPVGLLSAWVAIIVLTYIRSNRE